MKFSDICLIAGILVIVACSILFVPPRLTGTAVLAHILASSLVGSAVVVVSGIVVGWLSQRWKPVAYVTSVVLVVGFLVFQFAG